MDSCQPSSKTPVLSDMGYTILANSTSQAASICNRTHAGLAANVLVLLYVEFYHTECGIRQGAYASQLIRHLFTKYQGFQR